MRLTYNSSAKPTRVRLKRDFRTLEAIQGERIRSPPELLNEAPVKRSEGSTAETEVKVVKTPKKSKIPTLALQSYMPNADEQPFCLLSSAFHQVKDTNHLAVIPVVFGFSLQFFSASL